MTEQLVNPFDVTKAVDFDDQQIHGYWVDLPGGAGFRDLVKPTSPMPMFVLGGKGSGKTHLLRYFSYSLQKLRHAIPIEGVREDGYIGVYLRCGGLNASRFIGKGQSAEAWATLFQQYTDIWLAQLFLGIVKDAVPATTISGVEKSLCEAVVEMFDIPPQTTPQTCLDLAAFLRDWQRTLDIAINNAAISRQLDAEIRITPGRLVFGVPRLVAKFLPELHGIQVLYLIDELENLTESQQRYINTLIREKEAPCSFKVGARLYGVRTFETYSAGEINREGSEYEKLQLDDHLRSNHSYGEFALRLVARRLNESRYLPHSAATSEAKLRQGMRSFFEEPAQPLETPDRFLVRSTSNSKSRVYVDKLRSQLEEGLRTGDAPGVKDRADIDNIVGALVCPDPLLEKVNIFLLYQEWSRRRNLLVASKGIASSCAGYQLGRPSKKYKQVLGHFGGDLMAQLLADHSMKAQYVGFDTFVEMSRGLPRNLLVVLKHIFQWAIFNGEQPFRELALSVSSQQQGVMEASRWFFRDAEVLGDDGPDVQSAVRRLAELFRAIRFSNKPAECSLSTFAVDMVTITPRARQLIELAEQWSLLLRIAGGQRDKNSGRLNSRFQLNSMICPIWELPIYRRGTLSLSTSEVNAIFDRDQAEKYDDLVRARLARMTAPGFGRRPTNNPNTPLPLAQ